AQTSVRHHADTTRHAVVSPHLLHQVTSSSPVADLRKRGDQAQLARLRPWRMSVMSLSAKIPRPAGPAAAPPTWPPSAPRSPRPSKTPVTCTSPKGGATTQPPPRPSICTALISEKWDIHGTRRSPAYSPTLTRTVPSSP